MQPATAKGVRAILRPVPIAAHHGLASHQHLAYCAQSDRVVVCVRDPDLDTSPFDPYRCEPLVITARSRRDHPLVHGGDGAGARPVAVAVPETRTEGGESGA